MDVVDKIKGVEDHGIVITGRDRGRAVEDVIIKSVRRADK